LGSTAIIRRASPSNAPPMTKSSAKRIKKHRPFMRGRTSRSHHSSRTSWRKILANMGESTLPTKLLTCRESSRQVFHEHHCDPGMGMDFWEHLSSECPLMHTPRHGHKEASGARRGHRRRTTLVVRLTCEPSRVRPACVVQAEARVVPLTRRPTPPARAPQQAEGAPPTPPVGRRPHACSARRWR
jgi:hypothetical protein